MSNNGTVYLGSQRGNGPGFGLQAVYEIATDGMLRRIALREDSDSTIFTDGETATRVGPKCIECIASCSRPQRASYRRVRHVGNLNNGPRVLRVTPAFPTSANGDFTVASEDGRRLFAIQRIATRAHNRALTNAHFARVYFGYDSAGRLHTIMESDGNTTTISHDAAGGLTAITGPLGQAAPIGVDTNGFLATIANPLGDGVSANLPTPMVSCC